VEISQLHFTFEIPWVTKLLHMIFNSQFAEF